LKYNIDCKKCIVIWETKLGYNPRPKKQSRGMLIKVFCKYGGGWIDFTITIPFNCKESFERTVRYIGGNIIIQSRIAINTVDRYEIQCR